MRTCRAAIIALCCIAAAAGAARAAEADPQQLFSQANEQYARGAYAEAIALYERVRDSGVESPALYYNLGNAYYRSQRVGMARLWYEKALRSDPRDADIKHNLLFLRALQGAIAARRGLFEIVRDALTAFLTMDEATIILSIFYLIFITLLIASLYMRGLAVIWLRRGSAILLVAAGLWWAGIYARQINTKYAIIITNSADIRNGPGTNFAVGFTMPEGRKVIVLKKYEDWAEIGEPVEGLRGWVRLDAIGEI